MDTGSAPPTFTKRNESATSRVVSGFYSSWDEVSFSQYRDRFGLDAGKRVRELSQGMRVKFVLALALSRRSRLLVLDEPTSGLDPASREEVLDLLLQYVAGGENSVLFSTHIASDLDKCADDIVFIRAGKIVARDALDAFKTRYAMVDPARVPLGVRCLGQRSTKAGARGLVVRHEALFGGADPGVLETPTLDEIMSFDPKE